MTTWFVTRHRGAAEWAARKGLQIDRHVTHLDPDTVGPGVTVIGILPVHLVARLCMRGSGYLHLSLDLPTTARGRELSADELEAYGLGSGCRTATVQLHCVIPISNRYYPR